MTDPTTERAPATPVVAVRQEKQVGVAYVLLILFGLLGVHRFYLGKIGTGILYLFTLGLLGIGWICDLFTLPHQVRVVNALDRIERDRG